MAIVGGAVLPLMFARVADLNGIAVAFLVPMAAYLAIVVFAVVASKVVVAPRSAVFSATH
jgi:fucose permease